MRCTDLALVVLLELLLKARKAKVAYFRRPVLLDENVLALQIAM